MKRRAIQLALVWLLLAAAVVFYTDRDAYTWRYAQEELALILESRAEADAAQRAAEEAMRDRQAEALARTQAGIWEDDDMYGGAPETRPARDAEPGLNLMWGTYEATVCYTSPQGLSAGVVSAGRQPFIRAQEGTLPAAPEGGEARLSFTLTDSTERVMLACDVPEGAQITGVTVRKCGQGLFSPDLAAYALLAGGVLTWLLVLSWDERPEGRKRRRDAAALVCVAVFASLPCLMEILVDGHDLYFHMNRIEGIAAALRCGQLPARIHASTLLGYGYASPQFYPELFFYLPALMRNLGVSMLACVQVLWMLMNLATALVCYHSVRRMLGSREVALLSAVLYTLSIYRLMNVYARAALGEALAMIFFPLLMLAMAEVLTGDRRQWPLLALAMTGILSSHLLSTMFAAGFCALAALGCLPRLLREPRRILAILCAAGLTALCALGFVVPFLQYSATGISTNVARYSWQYALTPGTLLSAFSDATGEARSMGQTIEGAIGVAPGVAILVGCALLLAVRYAQGRRAAEEPRGRLVGALLALGVLSLACATPLLPWKTLCLASGWIAKVFRQIQFPWRLLGPASALLSVAAACGYLADARHRGAGAALALALCAVFAGYTLTDFVKQAPILDREGYVDTRIVQYEYTYTGVQKGALAPGDVRVTGADSFTVSAWDKQGSSLSLHVEGEGSFLSLEVPLLYYPGYCATVNGQPARVEPGDNGVVRIYGPLRSEGSDVQVWFEEPPLWRAAELASLAGAGLLLALLWRRRRAAA